MRPQHELKLLERVDGFDKFEVKTGKRRFVLYKRTAGGPISSGATWTKSGFFSRKLESTHVQLLSRTKPESERKSLPLLKIVTALFALSLCLSVLLNFLGKFPT